MKELISDIVNRFGGRYAGSSEERNAQLYLISKLKKLCDTATQQSFSGPLYAWLGSLRLFGAVHFIALGIYFVSPPVALLISLANSVLFAGHYLFRGLWLRWLWKDGKSLNVEGVIEPKDEVRQTVMLSGHMDSTREYLWWYLLGNTGVKLNIIGGISILILPVLMAITFFWRPFMPALVILSFPVITLLTHTTRSAISGAIDNLSGLAVCYGIAQHFSEHRLKHTRIRIISFGAEEQGTQGSIAYVKKNNRRLYGENSMLINLDGILSSEYLSIISEETLKGAKYPEWLVERVSRAFPGKKESKVFFGGTDAAPFAKADVPAVSIVGVPLRELHNAYHTRRDSPELIEESVLKEVRDALVKMIEKYD